MPKAKLRYYFGKFKLSDKHTIAFEEIKLPAKVLQPEDNSCGFRATLLLELFLEADLKPKQFLSLVKLQTSKSIMDKVEKWWNGLLSNKTPGNF